MILKVNRQSAVVFAIIILWLCSLSLSRAGVLRVSLQTWQQGGVLLGRYLVPALPHWEQDLRGSKSRPGSSVYYWINKSNYRVGIKFLYNQQPVHTDHPQQYLAREVAWIYRTIKPMMPSMGEKLLAVHSRPTAFRRLPAYLTMMRTVEGDEVVNTRTLRFLDRQTEYQLTLVVRARNASLPEPPEAKYAWSTLFHGLAVARHLEEGRSQGQILTPAIGLSSARQVQARSPHFPPFRLLQARSVAFTARVWEPDPTKAQDRRLLLQLVLSVKAARPASIYIVDVSATSPGHASFIGNLFYDVFVSDGKSQYEWNRHRHFYTTDKAAATLEVVKSTSGLTMFINPDILFAADPWAGFTFTGNRTINGKPAQVYTASAGKKEDRSKYLLFLFRRTGLPVRISYFSPDANGRVVEDMRTDYSDWKLNVNLPASTFDTTAPRDAKLLNTQSAQPQTPLPRP